MVPPAIAAVEASSSRFAQLVRRATAPPPDDDRCELCSAVAGDRHRHLLDLTDGDLLCVCQACRILFDHDAAGGDRYRLVPEERRRLEVTIDDAEWQSTGAPVGLSFFVRDSRIGGVVARYPSPAGPMEAEVDDDDWGRLVALVPELAEMRPDVEAFLVHRMRQRREHWIVPIDDCFRLVALVRSSWEGFTGGDRLWADVDELFERLEATQRR